MSPCVHTRTGHARALAAVFGTLAVLGAACGKKGPPLAPIVRLPAAVESLETRRVGDDVYVTLTVPALNIDKSKPADVARIELFAVTALAPPPRARFLEAATLVATVPVMPPLLPDGTRPSPPPGAPPETGAIQGSTVTLRDSLDDDDMIPRTLPPPAPVRATPSTPAPSAPAPAAGSLRRFYMAIAFSSRGRPGDASAIRELELTRLPDPPSEVRVTYTGTTMTVAWEPSGGLVGFLFERALPIEAAPVDEEGAGVPRAAAGPVRGDLPPGPTRYNVYRDLAPDPLVLPVQAASEPVWNAPAPRPINAAPVEALQFSEPVEFNRTRCYAVRAVRGTPPPPPAPGAPGPSAATAPASVVEGGPSARTCVTPVDTFPPAPPGGVSAIAAEGVISLIWEPNGEADLAGYVVLRGSPGDATLQPLVATPIAETRFSDRTAVTGQRYVYAVVAVDTRLPLPNVSAESTRVEETAR